MESPRLKTAGMKFERNERGWSLRDEDEMGCGLFLNRGKHGLLVSKLICGQVVGSVSLTLAEVEVLISAMVQENQPGGKL